MSARTIAIIGAGTMGRGIAQLAAQSGLAARLYDPDAGVLAAAKGRIGEGLRKGVERGKLTEAEADAALGRVSEAPALKGLRGADFVIEAAPEDLALKQGLFKDLDALFPPETVLATNTSSLPVRLIAGAANRHTRVLGMHFFNPPVTMRLVELVRHDGTSQEAFQAARELALELKRQPVEVKDTPGFLVNRVVRSYYLVAQRLAAEGAGSFREIDAAARERGKVPMGPFELMDFIGLEVNLAITRSIYEGLGRPRRLEPHPIQEKLVAAGGRGRKSGRGFYLYDRGRVSGESPEAAALLPKGREGLNAAEIWERIMTAVSIEADHVVEEGVASPEGVDTAVRLAMNFPKGPFEWRASHAPQA